MPTHDDETGHEWGTQIGGFMTGPPAGGAGCWGGAGEAAGHYGAGSGAGPQSRVGDARCEQAEELWAAAPAGRGESRAWGGADRGADGGEVRDADYVLSCWRASVVPHSRAEKSA